MLLEDLYSTGVDLSSENFPDTMFFALYRIGWFDRTSKRSLRMTGLKDGFTVVEGIDARGNRSVANICDPVSFQQHACPAAMVRPWKTSFRSRERFLHHRCFLIVQEDDTVILYRFTNRLAGTLQ